MQIFGFETADHRRIGVLDSGAVYDLATLAPEMPGDMITVLEVGRPLLERARDALAGAEGSPFEGVKVRSPIERPGQFICMGMNYLEHMEESCSDVPDYPALFLRVQTSLLPPDGEIVLPRVSEKA